MRSITIITSLLLLGSAVGVSAQNIEMQPASGGKLLFMPNATDTAFSITTAKTMRFTPGTGKLLIGASGSDFELPKARGTNGQVLTYNGTTHVAEWLTPAALPAGTANAFALYDASGNFTGVSGPLWDNSFQKISLGAAGSPSISGYGGLTISNGTGTQLQLDGLNDISVSGPASSKFSILANTYFQAVDSAWLQGGVRVGALGGPTWYKLPGTRGANGDLLYSNGTGGTYWSVPPASTSLSGTDGQLTYKAGASNLNTATGLTWDFANGRLGIGTNAPAQLLHVNGDAKITGNLDGGSMSLSSGMSVAGAAYFTSSLQIEGASTVVNSAFGDDFTLPGTRGASGEVLTSNGLGQTNWTTINGVPTGAIDRVPFYNLSGTTLTSAPEFAYSTSQHRLELGPNVAALANSDINEYLRIDGNAGINGTITLPATGTVAFGGVGTTSSNSALYNNGTNMVLRSDNGVTLQALSNNGSTGLTLLANATGGYIDMQANQGNISMTSGGNITFTASQAKFSKGFGLSSIGLINEGVNLFAAGGDAISIGDRGGSTYYTLPNSRGTNGQVLTITDDLTGATGWAAAGGADDLGNHTATQNLDLGTFQLVGNGGAMGIEVTSGGIVNTPSDVAVGGMLTIAASTAGAYDMPMTEGNNGQVLTSQGGGVTNWQDPAISLLPGLGTAGDGVYRSSAGGQLTSTSVFTLNPSLEEITFGDFTGSPVNIGLNGGGKFSFGSLSAATELSGDGAGLNLNATAANARITLNYGSGSGAVQVGVGATSYDLPTTRGANGQVLAITDDLTGATGWTTPGGGATGAINEMPYFSAANTLSGASHLQFDNTTATITLGSGSQAGTLHAPGGLSLGGGTASGPISINAPDGQDINLLSTSIPQGNINIDGGENNDVVINGGNVSISAIGSVDFPAGIDATGGLTIGSGGTEYYFPLTAGASGEVLASDGVGGVVWQAPGATVSVGSVTSIGYGNAPSVTNAGTPNAAIFDFVLVEGPPGAPGAPGGTGTTPTLSMGTVTTLASGSPATASMTPLGGDSYSIDFGIPEGAPGTIPGGLSNALVYYDGAGSTIVSNANLTFDGTIFTLNGDFAGTGIQSYSSDRRYKKNIALLPNALGNVMQLNGVQYDWRKEEFPAKNFPDRKSFGVIAQELEAIYPELVVTDAEGYKSVNYNGLIPVLLEAIKEQQRIIEAQNSKIETMEASQSSVQTQLFALKQQMDQLTRLMETATTTAKQD